jgi:hypothetical protein
VAVAIIVYATKETAKTLFTQKTKEVTNEKGISIYNKSSITIDSWYYM